MKIMENGCLGADTLNADWRRIGTIYRACRYGPMDIKSFAAAAEIDARYCEEWVPLQVRRRLLSHTEAIDEFYLSPEQKAFLPTKTALR